MITLKPPFSPVVNRVSQSFIRQLPLKSYLGAGTHGQSTPTFYPLMLCPHSKGVKQDDTNTDIRTQ